MTRRPLTASIAFALILVSVTSCSSTTGPRLLALPGHDAPTPTSLYIAFTGNSPDVFHLNNSGCISIGREIIIGSAGSSLSADGKTIRLRGVGTFRLGENGVGIGGRVYRTAPIDSKGCGAGPYLVAGPAVIKTPPPS